MNTVRSGSRQVHLQDLREEGVIDLSLTETIFRLWFCCVITSICVSAATVLGITLLVDSSGRKKKARLMEEDGPEDVQSTSSNLNS